MENVHTSVLLIYRSHQASFFVLHGTSKPSISQIINYYLGESVPQNVEFFKIEKFGPQAFQRSLYFKIFDKIT